MLSVPMTKLERFLSENDLRPLDVAREAGVSRQHLLRVRKGTADPTRSAMVRIANGCSRLLGRRVKVATLFNIAVRWR